MLLNDTATVNPNIHQCVSVTKFWIHLISKSKPRHIVTECLNFTCPYSNTTLVHIPYVPHYQRFLLGCEISYKVSDRQSIYNAIWHSHWSNTHWQMILILNYGRKRISKHEIIYCMAFLHFLWCNPNPRRITLNEGWYYFARFALKSGLKTVLEYQGQRYAMRYVHTRGRMLWHCIHTRLFVVNHWLDRGKVSCNESIKAYIILGPDPT